MLINRTVIGSVSDLFSPFLITVFFQRVRYSLWDDSFPYLLHFFDRDKCPSFSSNLSSKSPNTISSKSLYKGYLSWWNIFSYWSLYCHAITPQASWTTWRRHSLTPPATTWVQPWSVCWSGWCWLRLRSVCLRRLLCQGSATSSSLWWKWLKRLQK